MDIAADDLGADVLYQLGALEAFARSAGTRVRYVKPHGALYNTAADDPLQAGAVAASVARYDPTLPLLGLPGSELETAAQHAGIPFVAEGFADRAYTGDRLVPRSEPGAVHDDPAAVVAQAVTLARGGTVRSICVHGDTPGAVELARAVRAALEELGATPTPFVE
jgi:UPF0271 protein